MLTKILRCFKHWIVFKKKKFQGWGCSMIIESLPSMWKALGLILNTEKIKKKKQTWNKRQNYEKHTILRIFQNIFIYNSEKKIKVKTSSPLLPQEIIWNNIA